MQTAQEINIPESVFTHPAYQKAVETIQIQESKIQTQESKIQYLNLRVDQLREALFGRKSEKRTINDGLSRQISFLETDKEDRPEVEVVETEITVPEHTRRKRKRYVDENGNLSHFPEYLPREDIYVEPEGQKECEHCGKEKTVLSSRVTEKLQVIPAKYYVERNIQQTYVCNCKNSEPERAKAPESAIPKSVLGNSFLSSMLTNKFAWHLPFYRQSQMLEEINIEINRNVMINAANKLGDLLTPVVVEMAKQIKSCDVVHIDETPTVVAKRESNGKLKYNKDSYYWPILGGEQVVFYYTGNRKHCNVEDILGKTFRGTLQSDGYQAYKNYVEAKEDVTLAFCWDHCRRKFYKIKDHEPLANEALTLIKELYQVEREIKEKQIAQEEIPEYRETNALPILEDLKKWVTTVRDDPTVLPKSDLYNACSYTIAHWDGLTKYISNGAIPISNIKIEQQIRNLKLGAKNWLFASSESGARTVAVMNSLVCTCKMNGINILEYFNDILKRVDTDSASKLTPLAWIAEQNSKEQQDIAEPADADSF